MERHRSEQQRRGTGTLGNNYLSLKILRGNDRDKEQTHQYDESHFKQGDFCSKNGSFQNRTFWKSYDRSIKRVLRWI